MIALLNAPRLAALALATTLGLSGVNGATATDFTCLGSDNGFRDVTYFTRGPSFTSFESIAFTSSGCLATHANVIRFNTDNTPMYWFGCGKTHFVYTVSDWGSIGLTGDCTDFRYENL